MAITSFTIGNTRYYVDTTTGQQVAGPSGGSIGTPGGTGTISGLQSTPSVTQMVSDVIAQTGGLAAGTNSSAHIASLAAEVSAGRMRLEDIAMYNAAARGVTVSQRSAEEIAMYAQQPGGAAGAGGGGAAGGGSAQDAASAAEAARRSRDVFATIKQTLAQYGIEGGEIDALLTELIQNDAGEAEVMLKLRETQAWKTRFAGNELRRQRGMNVLDPRTYLAWEQQARQLMREANMPAGFMDENSDFAEMIGKDVSIQELGRRISNGYVKVSQAPIEIRQAFTDYFGANGDSALAALFLNYEKGADVLEKHVAAAEFGGTARRFGFRDDQVVATRAADLGITRQQAEQGMGQLIDINHLFGETVSESDDLVAEREGFGSVFGFTPGDAEKIRRRREQRVGSMSGSTSGAMITREGVLGFRTASTNE